jgi:LPXTG-site transpeptidase (sortase) family protein
VSEKGSGSKQETTVPLGLALVCFGMIILLTIGAILALSPTRLPDGLVQEGSPLDPAPQGRKVDPPAIDSSQVSVSQLDVASRDESAAILLPASPLQEAGLPSFARVEDAPTIHNATLPNQPARLIIPQLSIDAEVQQVGLKSIYADGERYFQWVVPDGYSAGWHETSAPLGQPGNTVLNGHNNIYGEVFRDLADLTAGSPITLLDTTGKRYEYEVSHQELMPENGQPLAARLENARWIGPTTDERLTLVSCWPYATNAYRLVVIATPIKNSTGS